MDTDIDQLSLKIGLFLPQHTFNINFLKKLI